MTDSAILELRDIEKYFPGSSAPVLSQVSLTLAPGEILSLLGPSGCGKTTLLRIIAGFESPSRGEIWLSGRSVASLPPEKRGIGMVFQDYALFPHLTVAKNLEFGLRSNRGRKKEPGLPSDSRWSRTSSELRSSDRIQTVLALVGLSGYENRYPHELSGGQQQRIALARALAPSPKLVLLDEPMSNLDVQVRLRLRQELRDILKRAGTSAVFVTHDQEEALSMADRVAVLNQGNVQQVGLPENIYQHPATRFVADFVTQANFLPATFLGGDCWQTELGTLSLSQDLVDCPLVELERGTQAELMVRQEDIELSANAEGEARVHDRQFLGREHRYSVKLKSGRTLFARSSTRLNIQQGQPVQLKYTGEQRIFVQPAVPTPVRAEAIA